MVSVAEVIRAHFDEILELWNAESDKAASARGRSIPPAETAKMMASYLRVLASEPDSFEKHRQVVEQQLGTRARQGDDPTEVPEELVLLGRCVARFWEALPADSQPAARDIERFHLSIQLATLAALELFKQHLQHDQLQEQHYFRLLHSITDEALRAPDAPLQSRLRELARLVAEATGAKLAAILLYDQQTGHLIYEASAGLAAELVSACVGDLKAISLGGSPGVESETLELPVNDTLRQQGVQSLLGVCLPPRHRVLGMMVIGINEPRHLHDREKRRLEAFAEGLTLEVDNATLICELRRRVEELGQEREMRERFVSLLAHDLRGPLTTAKVSARVLVSHPEQLEEPNVLAGRIERNLERLDRMVRDLLDANRVRAGERLPLELEECDLAEVVQAVVTELRTNFGDRFLLKTSGAVRGVWSAEELHRALWNLGTNAVQYGAAGQPITIDVQHTPEGARVSVHNLGPKIPPEKQACLFDPFSRLPQLTPRVQGWGLGLTLVRACAEGHGGRVNVVSSESGTTFTIELPLDARPFQTRAR